eukprot:5385752-Lingulodinium_polyedra.AAC.1
MGRAFWEMADADGRSAAALYFDVVAAFASVARELLSCPCRGDAFAAAFLARFGIDGSLEEE